MTGGGSRSKERDQPPELSVVLVSPGGLGPIARTVAHLTAQSAREEIELVIVGPRLGETGPNGIELPGFAGVRMVELEELRTNGSAIAAGVRASSGRFVVCAEEHSFPEPGWARALIDAHRVGRDVVGGAVRNANPATRASWAELYSDFGPAVFPAAGGESTELPGHHTAYPREILLAYGARLDMMLEVEWVLHEDLRARGWRLYLEPTAVSWHLNPSRLAPMLRSEFLGGRAFAANRAEVRSWSRARRLSIVVASPALPLLRLARLLPKIRRSTPWLVPRLLPVLTLSLLTSSLGQAVGYALGPGMAVEQRITIELERAQTLIAKEQRALAATPPDSLPRLAA